MARPGVVLAIAPGVETKLPDTPRAFERVIGRLSTDEEFRRSFARDPHRTLAELLEGGTHLTRAEIAALIAVDANLWDNVAGHIDPRLQKASLKNE